MANHKNTDQIDSETINHINQYDHRYWMKLPKAILNDMAICKLPDRLWRRFIELNLVLSEYSNGHIKEHESWHWWDAGSGKLPHNLDGIADMFHCTESELKWDLIEIWQFDSTLVNIHDGCWHLPRFKAWNQSSPDLSQWGKLRTSVLSRGNHKCYYCGGYANHVDHVIPRCQGGSDDPDNLVASCGFCNTSKNGRTPDQWPNNPLTKGR